jgi:hypothetical protein
VNWRAIGGARVGLHPSKWSPGRGDAPTSRGSLGAGGGCAMAARDAGGRGKGLTGGPSRRWQRGRKGTGGNGCQR